MPHGQTVGELMAPIEARIIRLEAAARQKHRAGLSSECRKVLTDRAVLHGDPEALHELAQHRPDTISGTREQRAAAVGAAMRADQ